MKVFVTGGSGFIGRCLVQRLVERGDNVFALARSDRSAAVVESLGATAVKGDILDVESMRSAMIGSDLVVHLAAWDGLESENWAQAEIINVGGTRRVLALAYELGVPRIVYVSTLGVFGNTKGRLVDESYYYEGPFDTEYERTKWLAHYRVALPLIKQGAPIIIVMPGAVYGPGDSSLMGELMERFYNGQLPFPFLIGPTTTLTYAFVEDVAEGILLASTRGKVGESYILAGPAVPLGELVDFWARLTGKRSPLFHVPARLVRPLAPLMKTLSRYIELPQVFVAETLMGLGATYMARSDKARTQLGWQPRSLHTGMLETFGKIAADAAERPLPIARERELGTVALGAAVALLLLWLLFRRRGKSGHVSIHNPEALQ